MAKNLQILEELKNVSNSNFDEEVYSQQIRALDALIDAGTFAQFSEILIAEKDTLKLTSSDVEENVVGPGSATDWHALQKVAIEQRIMLSLQRAVVNKDSVGLDIVQKILDVNATDFSPIVDNEAMFGGVVQKYNLDDQAVNRIQMKAAASLAEQSAKMCEDLFNTSDAHDMESGVANGVSRNKEDVQNLVNAIFFNKLAQNFVLRHGAEVSSEYTSLQAAISNGNKKIDEAVTKSKANPELAGIFLGVINALADKDIQEDENSLAKAEVELEIIKRLMAGLDDEKRGFAQERQQETQLKVLDLQVKQHLNQVDTDLELGLSPIDDLADPALKAVLAAAEANLKTAQQAVTAAQSVKSTAEISLQGKILQGVSGEDTFGLAIAEKSSLISAAQKKLDDYKAVADIKIATSALKESAYKIYQLQKKSGSTSPFSTQTSPEERDKALKMLQELNKKKKELEDMIRALSAEQRSGNPSTVDAAEGLLLSRKITDVLFNYRLGTFNLAIIKDHSSTIIAEVKSNPSQVLDVLKTRSAELEEKLHFLEHTRSEAKGIMSLYSPVKLSAEQEKSLAAAADQIKAVELILNETKIHCLCLQYQEELNKIKGEMSAATSTEPAVKAVLQQQWNATIADLQSKFDEEKKQLLDERLALNDISRTENMTRIRQNIISTTNLRDQVQSNVVNYYTPPPAIPTWIATKGQLSVFDTRVVKSEDPWAGSGAAPAADSSSEIAFEGGGVDVEFQRRKIASGDVIRSVANLPGNPPPRGGFPAPNVPVVIELDPAKKTAATRISRDVYNALSEESKQLAALQQANLLVTSCSNLKKSNIYIRCTDAGEANKLYAALLALGVPDKQIKSANKNIVRAGMRTWESTIIEKNLGVVADKAALMKKSLHDMKAKVKKMSAPGAAISSDAEVNLTRMSSEEVFTVKAAAARTPKP